MHFVTWHCFHFYYAPGPYANIFIQAKVCLFDTEAQNLIYPGGQINSGSGVYSGGSICMPRGPVVD